MRLGRLKWPSRSFSLCRSLQACQSLSLFLKFGCTAAAWSVTQCVRACVRACVRVCVCDREEEGSECTIWPSCDSLLFSWLHFVPCFLFFLSEMNKTVEGTLAGFLFQLLAVLALMWLGRHVWRFCFLLNAWKQSSVFRASVFAFFYHIVWFAFALKYCPHPHPPPFPHPVATQSCCGCQHVHIQTFQPTGPSSVS